MSNDIFFGRNSIRFYYYRYKDSAYYSLTIIVVTIVMCLLLIFQFIIPQFEQWFSIRSEVIATRERIAVIDENIAYMSTVDRGLLNSQMGIATSALPAEKNIGTILEALSVSSLRSGVSLQDYSFQVGNVASSSAQLSNTKIKDVSSITLSLVLDGTVDQVRVFMREIARTLPLSEVTSVDGSNGAIALTIEFYQKNLPKVTLQDDQPIPRVIQTNATSINQLSEWQLPLRSIDVESSPRGSESGIPLF